MLGHGSCGDVSILPTLVINNVQYRAFYNISANSKTILFCPQKGKLERSVVLKAICAGFKESTEPPVCLNGGLHDYSFLLNCMPK
ncbi:hypothetical protein ZIOFF_047711 [Zingiber officinale]|uniref:Uncharacterized protein n=1 Tax=Zingiber officinale TaxID=94328 RepID=A0A8J5FPK1_ZINOF|nr:hypothetical protein ZIOFF_047711 [Zingiber officinale]